MSLEVAYVETTARNLLGVTNMNQPPIGTGWTAAARAACIASAPAFGNCSPDASAEKAAQQFTSPVPAPTGTDAGTGKCFPYLNYIEFITNQDKSNYDGLQVTLTQRTSHGLSFTAGTRIPTPSTKTPTMKAMASIPRSTTATRCALREQRLRHPTSSHFLSDICPPREERFRADSGRLVA